MLDRSEAPISRGPVIVREPTSPIPQCSDDCTSNHFRSPCYQHSNELLTSVWFAVIVLVATAARRSSQRPFSRYHFYSLSSARSVPSFRSFYHQVGQWRNDDRSRRSLTKRIREAGLPNHCQKRLNNSTVAPLIAGTDVVEQLPAAFFHSQKYCAQWSST